MSRKDKIDSIKRKLSRKYENNKSRFIHDTCFCPICGKKFVKKTNGQVFCGSRTDVTCKDTYWNFMRYGTIPFPLVGDFKVLEPTKKDIEDMVGKISPEEEKETDEFINKLVEELVDLGNEEKKEFEDDFNDAIPVEGEVPFAEYSVPEDDFFI